MVPLTGTRRWVLELGTGNMACIPAGRRAATCTPGVPRMASLPLRFLLITAEEGKRRETHWTHWMDPNDQARSMGRRV